MSRPLRLTLIGLTVLLALLLGIHWSADSVEGVARLDAKPGAKTLVVVAHGMLGRERTKPLVALIGRQIPDADILTFGYEFTPLTNLDPYRLTSRIEAEIDNAYQTKHYARIVLVGHSAGSVLLRKALVWGSGYAEDRPAGRAGLPKEWPRHVERFVSIAGINRGWTIDPKPPNMGPGKWLAYWLMEHVARLSGTGELILSMQRGAPFIADLRVQWIHFARAPLTDVAPKVPFTIQLLGDIDDVVAKTDSKDIGVAKDVCFVTLVNTDHHTSVTELSVSPQASTDSRQRYARLTQALTARRQDIQCDPSHYEEHPEVTRVVFVMHGIRDYGSWTHKLTDYVRQLPDESANTIALVPAGYGYFPLMPFLLYGDRQRNVRWFMDRYTEELAAYPNTRQVDYIGHSNGTYILASALQRYTTLKVHNVYFAGSVVPQRYDWLSLIDANRVYRVYNVVATEDWVVAWFPRLFEQLSEWGNVAPTTGILDLGAAGFRGFRDGADPSRRVINLEFVPGWHGTAVDMSAKQKLDALGRYVLSGNTARLDALGTASDVNGFISLLSNVSWLVWLLLAALLGLGGYAMAQLGRWWLGGYVALVLLLLNSV